MNVREKKTHEYLTKLGFLVHTVSKPSSTFWKNADNKVTAVRKGQDHDLFGLWDHVGVYAPFDSKGEEFINPFEDRQIKGDVIWVQTKSRKQYGKELEKYKDFPGQKLLFVWTKGTNGRWLPPEITVL